MWKVGESLRAPRGLASTGDGDVESGFSTEEGIGAEFSTTFHSQSTKLCGKRKHGFAFGEFLCNDAKKPKIAGGDLRAIPLRYPITPRPPMAGDSPWVGR